MPLTWNLTNIPNYEDVCLEWVDHNEEVHGPIKDWPEKRVDIDLMGTKVVQQQTAKTRTLPYACLATGIGNITEKTAGEFFARLHILEKIDGAFLRDKSGPVFYTEQDIIDHIGFESNVSYTIETRTKWMNRVVKRYMDQRVSMLNSQRNRATVTA